LGDGFGDTRRENAILRLRRAAKPIVECMCREFSGCKFKPVMFEISTSASDPKKPAPLVFKLDDGSRVQITGKIDRVDTFKTEKDVYVRVIDYKSGSIDFKRDNLQKGEHLQMFLYLRSVVETAKPQFLKELGLENGGRLIPAGVAYVKTSLSDKSMDTPFADDLSFVIGEVNERYGMVLDDETALGAMSPDHLPKGIENDKNRLKYSEDEWVELCKTVEGVVKDITKDIRSGDIAARPRFKGSDSPCERCSYKPLCRSPKNKKD
ncbi:MAG: PD-(D/E)XK nuclease family protein, partial [Clostridia bacterium]|nr:PD-(D/E)XK nuclease family protein [Clostridia bacterium]